MAGQTISALQGVHLISEIAGSDPSDPLALLHLPDPIPGSPGEVDLHGSERAVLFDSDAGMKDRLRPPPV